MDLVDTCKAGDEVSLTGIVTSVVITVLTFVLVSTGGTSTFISGVTSTLEGPNSVRTSGVGMAIISLKGAFVDVCG